MPLGGRDAALRRLEEAYARVQADYGEVVLISGEAGIGKSCLMQDFATSLSDWALILAGAGHPDTQMMPYQPVIEALRSVLTVQPADCNLQLVWLAEASRLLPELRTLCPDLPPPLSSEPEEARGRLFEALNRLILGLTTSPLLLCLDDLHWADGATLDWLAYLGRYLPGNRLLVLGTYQSEEAGDVAGLRHHLARLGILSEVKLAELDAEAIL
ncbi:MAG: AAA family ATPase [Anaerolineae bacterium]